MSILAAESATASRPCPGDGPPARGTDGGTQCIQRSLGVMRMLASGSPQGMKLIDIADGLGLSRSTAHRILKVLEQEDMVERVAGSRRYTMGSEVAWLGLSATSRYPIVTVAAQVLDELSESIAEPISLLVRSRADSVCADHRPGGRHHAAVLPRMFVGMRRPLGVCTAGRMILAYMPDRSAEAVVEENRDRYRAYRCTPEAVLDDARRGRSDGYLRATGAGVSHRTVLAVPVLDVVGAPVAAISTITLQNGGGDQTHRLLAGLREAARTISGRLLRPAQHG